MPPSRAITAAWSELESPEASFTIREAVAPPGVRSKLVLASVASLAPSTSTAYVPVGPLSGPE